MNQWARIMSPALAMLLASAGVLGLLLAGCQMWPELAEERNPTEMTETITATIQAQDTAEPQQTETATFALG